MCYLQLSISTQLNTSMDEMDNGEFTEWQKGDGGYLDIPDSEQLKVEEEIGNERENSNLQFKEIPSLNGRSLEQVKSEAQMIRLHQEFNNFEDFERALDSWCFLNGRAHAKLKTKKNCTV
jgi:hypothetical protein